MLRLLELVVFCLGRLPISFRALVGRWLGWCFSFFPTRDREVARLQMNKFLSPEAGSIFIRKVYASLGETLMESINLKPILDNYQRYVTANWAQWDEVLSRKKPILILSAHTGNWDLLAACSVKCGYKVSVIGRTANQPLFQGLLEKVRNDYGVSTIWRSGSSGIKAIIEAFKKSESVGALIDQDTKVASRMIPFFGCPAATPSSIIELAKRCGALMVAPFIFRTGLNKFEIHVKEFDSTLPVDDILTDFNKTLEGFIRQHPSQWVWFHKRWRTLETGARLSSREYLAYLKAQSSS